MSIPAPFNPLGTLGASPLPPGWLKLDTGVYFDGTCYADTDQGITATQGVLLDADFGTPSANAYWGCYVSTALEQLSIGVNGGQYELRQGYGRGYHSPLSLGGRHKFGLLGGQKVSVDGDEFETDARTYDMEKSFIIGGCVVGGSQNKYAGRFYGLRIFTGNSVEHDYWPCCGPDGAFGIYDTVGKGFLTIYGTLQQ